MKRFDQIKPFGYPFDDVTVAFLQSMFDETNSFINALAGDNKIIKGMITNNQTDVVSEGLMTHGGKLYHFASGVKQSQITLRRVEEKRQYEDGLQKESFITEFWEFGNDGIQTINFSSLKRWYKNEPEFKEIKVIGNVQGYTPPEGWFIADGQNGTDDLRDRFFVIAGGQYNPGNTGGQNSVILTQAQMPAHNHTFTSDSDYGGDGNIVGLGGGSSANQTENTSSVGGGQAHENRPPYYAVIAIQFIG